MNYKKKSLILTIFIVLIIQVLLYINNTQKSTFKYFVWEIRDLKVGKLISISFVIPIFDILTGRDNKLLDTLLSNYTHLEIFIFLMILLLIFFLLKSLVVTLINYRVYKFCFK